MKQRKGLAVWLLLLAMLMVVGLTGCGATAPDVDWTLQITGEVAEPLTLSYGDLAAMDQTELTDVVMERSQGEDQTNTWSGVALEDLFAEAGADANPPLITAVAADGYSVEISQDELQGAIVALKEDGEWIAEADPDSGPIRLVCPEAPGNRWVFQLTEIQVGQ